MPSIASKSRQSCLYSLLFFWSSVQSASHSLRSFLAGVDHRHLMFCFQPWHLSNLRWYSRTKLPFKIAMYHQVTSESQMDKDLNLLQATLLPNEKLRSLKWVVNSVPPSLPRPAMTNSARATVARQWRPMVGHNHYKTKTTSWKIRSHTYSVSRETSSTSPSSRDVRPCSDGHATCNRSQLYIDI